MTVRIYNPDRAPRVWLTWMARLECSPGLAQRLWRQVLATRTEQEIGCIVRAGRRRDAPSVRAMLHVFSPKRLLQLTAVVSPEGRLREPEILQLEQRIVAQALSPTVWR